MHKTIIDRDLGKGFAFFHDAAVNELVHSAGVVVETGDVRFVYCSGKTATNDQSSDPAARDSIVGPGDVKEQTRQVLRNLIGVLGQAGATLDDVVRVRVYVKAPMTREMFTQIHEARSEFFSREHYPASTLVEVSGLARTEALIEIDADAVVAMNEKGRQGIR